MVLLCLIRLPFIALELHAPPLCGAQCLQLVSEIFLPCRAAVHHALGFVVWAGSDLRTAWRIARVVRRC